MVLRPEASLAIAQQNPAYFYRRAEKKEETNTAREIHSESFFERLSVAFRRTFQAVVEYFSSPAPLASRQIVTQSYYQINSAPGRMLASIQVPLALRTNQRDDREQIKDDLKRATYSLNGDTLNHAQPEMGINMIESQLTVAGVSNEEKKRIYGLYHQGLFGTALYLIYPNDMAIIENPQSTAAEIEAAGSRIALLQGGFLKINGQQYYFSPENRSAYFLNTEEKTVVGYRLISVDEETAAIRGAPTSFVLKVTYHYDTDQMEAERLSPEMYPA